MPKFSKEEFLGIKKPKWWHQETTAVFQLSYPWMMGFITLQKHFGKGYGVAIVPLKQDYGWHFLDENKSIELAQHVVDSYFKDRRYLTRKIEQWRKDRQVFQTYLKKIEKQNLKKLDDVKLYDLYNNFMQAYINEFRAPLVAESFEPFTTEIFYPQFKNYSKEQRRLLSVLEQPEFKSFITDQQISILQLALEVLNNEDIWSELKKRKNSEELLQVIKIKHPKFNRSLQKIADDYYWTKNNYKDTKVLTPSFFLQVLRNEIKKKNRHQLKKELDNLSKGLGGVHQRKKEIIEELGLDKKTIATFEVIDQVGKWHDQRKKMMLIGNHYLNLILQEIARRKKYTLREVHYTHPREIEELLLNNKRVDKKLLAERRKFCIWIGGPNQEEYWYSGEEAQKLAKLFLKKEQKEYSAITGIAASPGRVTGKVRIVLDPHKDTIKEGEILVCPQTRPEFLHLMQKAKAIVTNEGGLTCHAAIVSRELGIPCVVGTKIATKALKNGDIVDVYAHRGEIIKKV